MRDKGITLIALIITVIVMLILAGVAISMITSGDGIFKKVRTSSVEYQKSVMKEMVRIADMQLEIDNKMNKKTEKKIEDLVGKMQESAEINLDKYKIKYGEENENKCLIIDKGNGATVEVIILETGKVEIIDSQTDDISNLEEPVIEYTLNPIEKTYADEIEITIKIREAKNGVVNLQLPDKTIKTYDKLKEVTETYKVNKNGVYKFIVEDANGIKTSKYVTIRYAKIPADIQITSKNTNVTSGKVDVEITYDENYDDEIKDAINRNKYQYKIGDAEWQNAKQVQKITIDKNTTISARYFDGNDGYKTASLVISNIDKEKPNEFNLNAQADDTSIIVTGSTTDIGSKGTDSSFVGISGYQFQLKSKDGKVLTDWTNKQQAGSYTFSGLTNGEAYKVSMRAIDLAGNVRNASNNEGLIYVISKSFSYNGSSYTFTVPKTGKYKLEVWGAQGGYRSSSAYGGLGGYSTGNISLTEGTNLYVYVGGSGNRGGTSGGYNGGGSRASYAGGGGATDIRFVSGSWNSSAGLLSRVIVAGGGGSDGAINKNGMYGGGTSGGTTTQSYGTGGDGATQTSGGAGNASYPNTKGTFGKGGYGYNGSNGFAGAGGGGWYGGAGSYVDGSGDDDRGGRRWFWFCMDI